MYKLKLWNKKYGAEARFVAYDPTSKKYTEFQVDHTKDIIWTSHDLTKEPEYKNWEDWKDEPVNFLEDVMM